MRLNTGIITQKLGETRDFFIQNFGFHEKFASDWFVLLCTPENQDNELAIMLENQPQVRLAGFQQPYEGRGVWLILETADVEAEFQRLSSKNVSVALPLTEEALGDYHSVLNGPSGLLIDIVQQREVNNAP